MEKKITVADIYRFIDSFAPFDTQESWDNSGLLVGSSDAEIHKIGVALEVTPEVLNSAAAQGIDLIVTHHPVIFHPVKSVLRGSVLWEAIRLGLNVICCHTPLDKAEGGVNDTLARLLDFQQLGRDDSGFLRTGVFDSVPARELAERVRVKLHAGALRCCGLNRRVDRAAVCSGAGASLLADAKALGCDALITGDAGHHDFLDAEEMGITLIAAGHYETETIVAPVLRDKILEAFPALDVAVLAERNPIAVVGGGDSHGA
ncbi:MAG: Nif3-like dinuclear metal center hexameric protein [Clostridia bacterium]